MSICRVNNPAAHGMPVAMRLTARFPILRKMRSFQALDWRERLLVAEAAVALSVAVSLVRWVPYRRWKDRIGIATGLIEASPVRHSPAKLERARRIAHAVTVAERNLPFSAVCLPQAMAAHWMLERRGIDSQLYVGVRGNETHNHELHAWLQSGDTWLLGRVAAEGYTSFAGPSVGPAGAKDAANSQ